MKRPFIFRLAAVACRLGIDLNFVFDPVTALRQWWGREGR